MKNSKLWKSKLLTFFFLMSNFENLKTHMPWKYVPPKERVPSEISDISVF